MAQFSISYRKTAGHEGGYSNHPSDRGGETYRGIARNRWQSWEGWEIVDRLRKESDFPANLEIDPDLSGLVVKFYHDNFWVQIMGDSIPTQGISDELYDTSVNMGTGQAIKFLQQSLNVLNRNQRDYMDVKPDGKIGQQTLGALSAYLGGKGNTEELLLKVMNLYQGCRYLDIMADPSQEVFARGWLNRVDIIKT